MKETFQKTRYLTDGSIVIGRRLLIIAAKNRYSDHDLFFLLYLYLLAEEKLTHKMIVMTYNELGKRLNIHPNTLGKKIKDLEKQGIVQIKPHGNRGQTRIIFNEEL